MEINKLTATLEIRLPSSLRTQSRSQVQLSALIKFQKKCDFLAPGHMGPIPQSPNPKQA